MLFNFLLFISDFNPYDFPNVQKCGNISVWNDYAAFHTRVVSGKEKGKYLQYNCVSQFSCGGWGNRLKGISVALTLAMIARRALVISMPHPVDINVIVHPKAIMWNHSVNHLSVKKYFMVDPDELNRHWPSFIKMLMHRNSDITVDVMDLQTNLGFFWFMPKFSEELKELFNKYFPVSTAENYQILYGCIQRYLFTYDKIVTDAIQKEMSDLSLQPGRFVSAHYRTQLIENDNAPPTPLDPGPQLLCATMAAEALGHKIHLNYIPTYLITDGNAVEDYAHKFYKDKIVTSPVEKIHIDRTNLKSNDALPGYVGVFVNIEVAAKAAVFLRFGRQHSSMAELIVSLGRSITTVIQCGRDYNHCQNDTSICKKI